MAVFLFVVSKRSYAESDLLSQRSAQFFLFQVNLMRHKSPG